MDKYDQEIYREEILEHYRHPQNFGAIIKPTHVGSSENPLCGDSIILELSIKNKKGCKSWLNPKIFKSGEGDQK